MGRRLGGPFATLAWLRLASVLPGVLACLLGWLAARRWWDPWRALYVLALFALSPALTYYSVELRNYAWVHCLLLVVLIGLLELTHPGPARWRTGVLLLAAGAILVFYMHSLSFLYLGFFALIFLAEIALQPSRRKALLLGGLTVLVLFSLCATPWISIMARQTAGMNESQMLAWANWRDLPLTFFWHLPLGYWPGEYRPGSWFWFAIGLNGAGLLALAVNAWLRSRKSDFRSQNSAPDRLLIYSAVMATLPVLTAILLSWFHIAKISLRYRYNLVAAPFFMLMLAGLLFRIRETWLRRCLLASVLMLCAGFSAVSLRTRLTICNEILSLAQTRDPEMFSPNSRFYWASSAVPQWLNRSGSFRIGRFEEALDAGAARPAGNTYFLTHKMYGGHHPTAGLATVLLESILTQQGVPQVDLTDYWEWENVWRLSPHASAEVRAKWQAARRPLETRHASIPGGQVILPDEAFVSGSGWSRVWYEKDWMPQCWTEGPWQMLEWSGPMRPGRISASDDFFPCAAIPR